MSRLLRFSVLAVCLTALPTSARAGITPWMVTSVSQASLGQFFSDYAGFSPYYTSYTPYYAGYASTGYSSYYGPYSTGYAPGIACGSCGSCSSCASCGCAPCGCSPCGVGCASGNCATGNCSSGCGITTPASGTLKPVADPNNGSRTIEERLDVIERSLNISAPRSKTYAPDEFRNRTRPADSNRTRDDATDPDGFPAPVRNRTTPTDDGKMFEPRQGTGEAAQSRGAFTEKIPIPGDPEPIDTTIQSKRPAPGTPVDDQKKDDQSLRLDYRVTSRAVAPRERLKSTAPATVANSRKNPKLHVDAQPRTAGIVR